MLPRFFDLVFVAQKDYVATYRQVVGHDQVYWLPLAGRPRRAPPSRPAAAVRRRLCRQRRRRHKRTNSRMRRLELLSARYHTNDVFAPTPVEEVSRIYSQARIVFNTSIAGDVTMRVFEGTASGALLLTDSVQNGLDELFEIGKELVVFGDDEDMLAKVDYYLAHEEERAAIAAAGYRRTHADHTYQRRVQQVVATVTAPGNAHGRTAAYGRRADCAGRAAGNLHARCTCWMRCLTMPAPKD